MIDLAALKDAGVVRSDKKRAKIVLRGQIDRAVTIRGVALTKGAREAVEKAGGKIEE